MIEARIEAVTFMMTEKGFMTRLEDVLKKFNGITDILRFFQRLPEVAVQSVRSNEKKFKVIYMIRNALRSIHSLVDICQDCDSKTAMLGQFCQVKSN